MSRYNPLRSLSPDDRPLPRGTSKYMLPRQEEGSLGLGPRPKGKRRRRKPRFPPGWLEHLDPNSNTKQIPV